MLNHFLRRSFLLLQAIILAGLCSLAPRVALAQECDANFEMVTRLFHPNPGSFAVWETNYGEDDRSEKFYSLTLPIDGDQGAVAAGVNQEGEKTPLLLVVRVDYRGRPVWEKNIPVEGLGDVVKILQRPEGYLVAANTKSGIWIGFLDPSGNLMDKKILAGRQRDLAVKDIIPSIEDKGWLLAVTETKVTGSGRNASVRKDGSVYKIDTSGNIIINRSFEMGGDNEILGLSEATFKDQKSGYIATGYLENSAGKKMGVAMRLEPDGFLNWQQEFNRGLNAQLKVSHGYLGQYVLAFGDVRPSDAGAVGTWLMLLDGVDGKTLWQRYYNSEKENNDYLARGIAVNEDNLITLMMAAPARVSSLLEDDKKVADEAGNPKATGDILIPDSTDYTHVLTLSPRGVTLAGASYFQGKSVDPWQLITGPRGERMIAGSTLAQMSEVTVPRDFHPDWSKDFAYGPMAEDKPDAVAKPNLPEGVLSEKTKSGLALLNKKLKAQVSATDSEKENQIKTDKTSADVQENFQPKTKDKESKFSNNAWIVIGEPPEPYVDPCKKPNIDLPKEK